jgi:uncharacterized protein involved in propanediol utilization
MAGPLVQGTLNGHEGVIPGIQTGPVVLSRQPSIIEKTSDGSLTRIPQVHVLEKICPSERAFLPMNGAKAECANRSAA